MNFYDFLKQKYDNYKIDKGCESCPCKMLRDKIFDGMCRGICVEEIIYLSKKYNIRNNAHSCKDCMVAALKIAKKMSENFNRI